MSVVKLPDSAGNTITLRELDGVLYPPFPVENLEAMSTFKLRPDDVLVCTYPKSGTHWMAENLHMLLSGKAESSPPGFNEKSFMETRPPGGADSFPSPRVLVTHFLFDKMPKGMLEKKCKVVFVYRNPKDVAVSFYNHHKKSAGLYEYQGPWSSYFDLIIGGKVDYGKWTDYMLNWERGIKAHPELPVHVTSFEDMKEHPLRELRKLATFLEKDYEEDFLQQVRDKCSFSSMQNVKGGQSPFKTPDGKPIMYRKGETGDWKNLFTVAQNEQMDAVLKREMAGSTFKWRETIETPH